MLRFTKLFIKYRTKEAAVCGKIIQQHERLMQAQAYLLLLSCPAVIWNYLLRLHKSRRKHQFLYENYHDKGEGNKKEKIFERFLSRNMMRKNRLGNLGLYERITLTGIRKHEKEVWNGFMCLK
jgi:hypothetical protein